jgi:hypothetical protein
MVRKWWPVAGTDFVCVEDVSRSVQKKFHKAIKANWSYWLGMQHHWCLKTDQYADGGRNSWSRFHAGHTHEATRLFDSILKAIPRAENKLVAHRHEDMRGWNGGIAHDTTNKQLYTSFLHSAIFRSTIFREYSDDFTSNIQFAITALNTFPPLSEDDQIPYVLEVHVLHRMVHTQTAIDLTAEDESAPTLQVARCCAAAMRLLVHKNQQKKFERHEIMSCKEMCMNRAIALVLFLAASSKIEQNVSRPLFTTAEINGMQIQMLLLWDLTQMCLLVALRWLQASLVLRKRLSSKRLVNTQAILQGKLAGYTHDRRRL